MWRLLANFPLSCNLLPCLSLTRSRRASMEKRFRPSHCLICLGKALTSNTNLNDSSGNLGSVSEARLGLAQWPSLREHGKFAGSICHSQHELRKRTRKEWLNGLDPWLALVECSPGCTMRLSEIVSGWNSVIVNASNFTELRMKRKRTRDYYKFQKHFKPNFKGGWVLYLALQQFTSLCMSATSPTHQWRSIKPDQHYNKWQSYHFVRRQT